MAAKLLYPREIYGNALTAQADPLELEWAGPATERPAGCHHPVTRCGAIATTAQHGSYRAGRTWGARQSRNVAVGGDAPRGNPAHGGKHACRKPALWLRGPVRHRSLQPIRF